MLTTVNPGVFKAPDLLAFTPGFFIVVFLAALAFSVWAAAKAESKSTGRNRLAAITGTVALVLGATVAVVGVTSSNQYNDAVNEHRGATQSWLASDYGIDVTLDETNDLIGRPDSKKSGPKELVVDLDGDLTSIKLIEGTGSTLQVQVVGGQVMQPRN